MAGEGGMINVTGKAVTVRTAKAAGRIELGPEAFEVLRSGSCVKGDVLGIAKAAAIQAVKSTPAMIVMCHPILIEAVEVDFALNEEDKSVTAAVTVKSCGKTGVEMEALCGAAVACLSIYDMLKYVSREMTVTDLRLIEKTGGKSGDFKRQD
ncbi:MAG: cyclic pyranopterin monophosphate synthase MoaC [Planctomycetota bacterium]|jgi:cyclic pyranopterin phosphate synthase